MRALSTPSLGITECHERGRFAQVPRRFQLPLSGSLGDDRVVPCYIDEWTFNSLSRDHRTKRQEVLRAGISIFQLPLSGSLGLADDRFVDVGRTPFNSLSRDHELRVDKLAHGASPLSTPSLGITRVNEVDIDLAILPFNSLSRDHRAAHLF